MRKYDHFHVKWKDGEVTGEIEGGWLGYPEGWDTMTKEEEDKWIHKLAVNWGMPETATVEKIWLAG